MKACWPCLMTGLLAVVAVSISAEDKKVPDLLQGKMKSLKGKDVDLSQYQGKVLFVVNVASDCGATPQYKQLQALHDKYDSQGLEVLGFPCNQFGGQEPKGALDIAEFCETKYKVKFDMFDKIEVNGEKAAPIFKKLTAEAGKLYKESEDDRIVKWNFEKFLVSRDGKVVARFRTGIQPDAPEVVKAIETELAKK